MNRPTIQDTTVDHQQDSLAIQQLIAEIEAGFNQHDPAQLMAPLMQNAVVVNVAGKKATGWDALYAIARDGLAGPLRNEYARYTVQEILYLRPDVAVAHIHGQATTPTGELLPEGQQMIAHYIFVKELDRWWVASRQNTLIT